MTLEEIIASGYLWGAPSQKAEEIDAEIASGMICRCNGNPNKMYYDGYHNANSYVALAVCPVCKKKIEF